MNSEKEYSPQQVSIRGIEIAYAEHRVEIPNADDTLCHALGS